MNEYDTRRFIIVWDINGGEIVDWGGMYPTLAIAQAEANKVYDELKGESHETLSVWVAIVVDKSRSTEKDLEA